MKLFVQHGYGEGQKVQAGIDAGYIDGVIYSPKDIGLGRLQGSLDDLAKRKPAAERLFDPQYYATLVANAPNSRCGLLMSEYAEYFSARRRGQLEQEGRVRDDLRDTLRFTKKLNLSSVITPGIFVPRSLNSIEAVIAKNFIRFSKTTAKEVGESRPVLATLAISCEALRRHQELIEFLTDLTLLENPPDGFYLLVGTSGTDGRQEIYHADTIAGWLFLTHTLALNGLRAVNGYSDRLTPFLGACGAAAGASGWWSNLRNFGLGRFAPEASGGRLPTPRYLSCALLNRITFDELERLRGVVPDVLNGLPTDKLYPVEDGSEPERNQEVLQSWDAIRELNRRLVAEGDTEASLANCRKGIADAAGLYLEVQGALFSPLDSKSDDSHLAPLSDGLELFAELAELDSP
ncbi:MAG: hypothetical protein KIT44_00260 [Opitutaceae bacterium]|nr:hypothetical protein [Opitutaceae bacterium]